MSTARIFELSKAAPKASRPAQSADCEAIQPEVETTAFVEVTHESTEATAEVILEATGPRLFPHRKGQ